MKKILLGVLAVTLLIQVAVYGVQNSAQESQAIFNPNKKVFDDSLRMRNEDFDSITDAEIAAMQKKTKGQLLAQIKILTLILITDKAEEKIDTQQIRRMVQEFSSRQPKSNTGIKNIDWNNGYNLGKEYVDAVKSKSSTWWIEKKIRVADLWCKVFSEDGGWSFRDGFRHSHAADYGFKW